MLYLFRSRPIAYRCHSSSGDTTAASIELQRQADLVSEELQHIQVFRTVVKWTSHIHFRVFAMRVRFVHIFVLCLFCVSVCVCVCVFVCQAQKRDLYLKRANSSFEDAARKPLAVETNLRADMDKQTSALSAEGITSSFVCMFVC